MSVAGSIAKPRARRRGLARIEMFLIALIAVGGVLLIVPAERDAESEPTAPRPAHAARGTPSVALPEPVLARSAAGLDVARLDIPALQEWCRAQGLPTPPNLPEVDPEVAKALMAALKAVAAEHSAEHFGRMGMISACLGCDGSALEYFRAAVAANPAEFRWRYYLGTVEQTLGDSEAALATFEHARKQNPQYPMTYGRMAEIHLAANRLDRAQELFRTYIERRPDDSFGYVGLSRIALARNAYAQAVEHARAGAARDPRDFQVAYCLARGFAGLGRDDEARQAFDFRSELDQQARLDRRDPLIHELRASAQGTGSLVAELVAQQDSQDWKRLAEVAEQIVARRPGDVPMLANLAGYYRKQGRIADAHAVLDRADKEAPNNVLTQLARAELFLSEQRFPEAVQAAERALASDPRSARAFNVVGRAEFMRGAYDQSVDAMRAATDIEPENASNVLMLAEALRAGGRQAEAADAYRRVLVLVPNHAEASRRLSGLAPK